MCHNIIGYGKLSFVVYENLYSSAKMSAPLIIHYYVVRVMSTKIMFPLSIFSVLYLQALRIIYALN